ncbi:hypothetical protein GCM10009765_47930 [Fodinicola feengrottensis]|uniref:DUF1980 domain-containing protein n=1 Tax=Fodinicola feengrottensis TaxID=435914 RepID=A0ABP4TSS7_9ACTN
MSEDVRATTVLLVGAMLIKLFITDAYARYVRVGMGWWLLVAGILLVALGLASVVRVLRPATLTVHDDDHNHSLRIGWLLLAPVVALLLVTPPSLGSFGVDRNAAVSVTSGGRTFSTLPAGPPVTMTLLEYGERVADQHGASFGSVSVRLTGFVVDAGDSAGFRIARYQIACCAADAVASVVRVTGAPGDRPARDQWVTIVGGFQRSADDMPQIAVTGVTPISAPPDPYE